MILNSNLLLASGDYIQGAVLQSAGSSSGGPVQNPNFMANNNLWQKTSFPSTGSLLTFTYFLAQLSEIDVVAILRHNIPAGVEVIITFRLGNDIAGSTVSTHNFIIKQSQPSTSLSWGAFSWGDQVDDKQKATIATDSFFVLPSTVVANIVEIQVLVGNYFAGFCYPYYHRSTQGTAQTDNDNLAPYTIGRVWASNAFQPSVNVNYGAEISFMDETASFKTKSGVKFFETNTVRRRTANVTFELLPKNEMMSALLGPYHISSGKREEVILVLEPTKPETFFYSALYGHIVEPDKASFPWWEQMSTSLYVEEAL